MNLVVWPSGSGYWSHILLTPAMPPADVVPLPLPTGLPLAAPLTLPDLFPVAIPLVFTCEGSCPLLYSRSQKQLTLVHPMKSYQSTCNIKYSQCQQKHKSLEIQRGHDQLTIYVATLMLSS